MTNSNPHNPMITCCYLNIRSLVNKLSLFQSYIYSLDLDVYCLTETWLSNSIFDQEILPTNNNIYHLPNANYDGILSYLFDLDYSQCLQSQDVESIWCMIKNSIYNAMDLFIPKVRLRRHQFPCWYTPELRHLSKCIHTCKKRLSRHSTPHLELKTNNLESEYCSKALVAKSNYESQLVQSFVGSNNARIYDYIRSLSKKSSIPSMFFFNHSNATSDTEKAEVFNSFFHSVFTGSSFSLPDMSSLQLPPSCICTISLSDSGVLDALLSLDPTKSSGCDGIGPKLIKHCALALYIRALTSLLFSEHD